MEYPIAFLGFGILLLVIGLVGGDLSYRGFTIPKVGPLPRFTTTISGAVCVAISALAFVVQLEQPAPTPPPPSPVADVTKPVWFSVADQLTDHVEEETIVISLEGNRIAQLHATRDEPVVRRDVQVAEPGNYSYVVDAEMVWLDDEGNVRTTDATGRGSVHVDKGIEFQPVIHFGGDDEISLSLENTSDQS